MDRDIAAVMIKQLVKLDLTSYYCVNVIDQEGRRSQCKDRVLAVGDNMTPEETDKKDNNTESQGEI